MNMPSTAGGVILGRGNGPHQRRSFTPVFILFLVDDDLDPPFTEVASDSVLELSSGTASDLHIGEQTTVLEEDG
jgi:hypothetical protein